MRILRKIRNLIRWFPIIWNDNDWDSHYLLLLIYHKLRFMEQFFSSDDTHLLHADKTAEQIKTTKLVLKRILDDNYWPFDKLFEKYGDFEIRDSKFEIVGVETKDEKLQYRKEFSKCSEAERLLEQQDWNYFFKLLKNHMKTWWD